MDALARTPLHDLHVELGARMVPFAGHEMPVQYPDGVMAEHRHCREAAALFDVSHMGQARLTGEGRAAALEALTPASVAGLATGRQRYALLTDAAGGILDDFMVADQGEALFLVVNAANRAADIAHIRAHLPGAVTLEVLEDRALLALQGPEAEAALAPIAPGAGDMRFMDAIAAESGFGTLWISRSGYTGEDGFEISVPAAKAEALARALLAAPGVRPAGLGARDSLRLEAGLCLHGSDIDTGTSPVEAGLGWSIQKVRRRGGAREGGFPGAARILDELESGAPRTRVGLRPEGRAPMRAGTALFASETDGTAIGTVTSGGFGPSVGAPIAMGYVASDHAAPGTRLFGEVRGRRLPVSVAPLPFHPTAYKR